MAASGDTLLDDGYFPAFAPSLPTSASRLIKVRGIILLVLGPALSVGMAYLIYYFALMLDHDRVHPADRRWHGSHDMTVWAFSLFGTICFFGLVAFVGGISLLRRGRVHPVLIGLLVLCVLGMAGLGYLIVTAPASP